MVSINSPKVSINDLPELLTVLQVAEVLCISSLTLKRWGKKGILVPIRINSRGDRRYKKEQLIKFIASNI